MKQNRPEFDLHKACVDYAKLQYENKGLCFLHHSPNEAIGIVDKKVMFQQNKFQQMGRKLGFPDLMILCKSNVIFIEFKSKIGKLSINQIDCIEKIHKQNYKVYVVKSFEEFKLIIDNFILHKIY